ncbi:MAG: hypothetical protein HY232_18810 [Acidobacteria bacterium]|nr:hypothetical protein [Acidobacteriota bacterium]
MQLSTSLLQIFLDPTDPDTLYGGGSSTSKSTDGGITWQPISALYGAVAVDPTDPRIIFLAGMSGDLREFGIYKSTDAGGTWKKVADYFPAGNIVVDPEDTRTVYSGAVTGIAKSTDAGETWTRHSRGLSTMNVSLASIAPSDSNILYATGSGGVSKSTDAGEHWSELRPRTVLAIDPTDPDTVYGPGYEKGQRRLMRSTDAGETWVAILNQLTGPMAIDPNNPNVIYAAVSRSISSSDVYKTTDGGLRWTSVRTVDARFFTIDPADSQIIYIGTFRSGVYKSADGGRSWRGVGLSGQWVYSVTIDEENPSIVYAAAINGLHKSEDRGERWERLSTFAPRMIVIDPGTRDTMYGSTTGRGVYKSVDGGRTWEPRNLGLTVTLINAITIARDTGRLYIATAGASVWFSDDQAETWQ